jgi:mono/diheme cytochrome c family protein
MKINRTLAMGSFILALGWPAASALAADADAGKALYTKNCQGCHGADGKGNAAMVKAMGEKGLNITTKEVAQMPDEQLLKVISDGAGKMPKSKLSKAEQKQVLDYSRTLAK